MSKRVCLFFTSLRVDKLLGKLVLNLFSSYGWILEYEDCSWGKRCISNLCLCFNLYFTLLPILIMYRESIVMVQKSMSWIAWSPWTYFSVVPTTLTTLACRVEGCTHQYMVLPPSTKIIYKFYICNKHFITINYWIL